MGQASLGWIMLYAMRLGAPDEPVASWPNPIELANAAVRRAGLEGTSERQMHTRSRRAPWLPELSVRMGRTFGTRESFYGDELDSQLRKVDDLRLEARATWHLDKLLYASAELDIVRENRLVLARRRELEEHVIELFFERKRLLAMPKTDPETEALRHLRRAEIEALLDCLTGKSEEAPKGPRRPNVH